MPEARFITFEGGDGSGKSTLLGRVEADFKKRRIDYALTREPGGTPVAEEIREVILKSGRGLDPRAELLLFEAARAEHVARLIRPTLKKGRHVLCDRFTHSSVAYQGAARGLGEDLVHRLNAIATDGLEPDAVVWLKLDPRLARQRVESRASDGTGVTRIDAESEQFHKQVYRAFEKMVSEAPERFIVLDASAKPEAVYEELCSDARWTAFFGRMA